jgi:ADP-heptose:LPS heptosyltransferase
VARDRGKILVIRGGAIGDFILTLPVLAALRRTFPETHLEVLAYPKLAELARAGGLLDGFRSIEARPLAGFFARGGALEPELVSYFESFALVFSYLYDPDGILRTNVALSSRAQIIQGPHRPDETESIHATDVFLKPLEQMAIFDADPVPRLEIALQSSSPAAARLAVHPGSGSPSKNWPEEKWLALLRRIVAETSWNLLLIGGEAEGDRIQRFASLLPAERVAASFNRPLADLALDLRAARFFLGHDSGIAHLAAALGIPVLALWGKSNDRIWQPRHPAAEILKHPAGLEDLDVNTVFDRIPPPAPSPGEHTRPRV